MKKYFVFDWGGTFLKYALMNEEAQILEQGKVPSPSRTDTKEVFMETIDQAVEPYLDQISGIAVSSPGIIDSENGIIRLVAVFPYLNGCNIKKEFEERYHVPVSLENDGKSAALAEYWKGNLQGCDSGAVVLIGTGVGGGLILDGKLRRGKTFMAGEFSSVCTDIYHADQKESYWADLGYKGLFRRYQQLSGEDTEEMDGMKFFALVHQGNAFAKRALEQYCDHMAIMLYSLNVLLDLDRICIGGGISKQAVLTETLKKAITDIRTYNPDILAGVDLPLPEVSTCAFYNDANLIGALYHHLYE